MWKYIPFVSRIPLWNKRRILLTMLSIGFFLAEHADRYLSSLLSCSRPSQEALRL